MIATFQSGKNWVWSQFAVLLFDTYISMDSPFCLDDVPVLRTCTWATSDVTDVGVV